MKLYRYRGFERGFDEIKNSYLWFTGANQLNDIFDGNPIFSGLSNIGEAWLTLLNLRIEEFIVDPTKTIESVLKDFPNNFSSIMAINDIASENMRKVLNEMGVCCFSEIADSLLMWAHYTAGTSGLSGTGICIEYESKNEPVISGARSVQYVSSRQSIPVARVFDKDSSQMAILSKSLEWSYEREWRVTAGPILPGADRKISISPATITSVYCGPRISSENLGRLVGFKKEGNRGFKIYYSRDDEIAYKINFHECN